MRSAAPNGACTPLALRSIVVAHVARDARETAAKERILAELGRLDSPCDREADPVHVTASTIVVGPRGTVLHRHRLIGRWLQPGGHVDAGEAPPEAAVRETAEETGLAVVHPTGGPLLVHVDVHGAPVAHVHLDLRYLVLASDEDPSPAPGESPDARWFSWAEAEDVADVALVGALHAARRMWEEGVGSDR